MGTCPKSVVVEPKAKPLRPQISVNDSCASGAVDRGDRTGLRAIVAAGSSASRREVEHVGRDSEPIFGRSERASTRSWVKDIEEADLVKMAMARVTVSFERATSAARSRMETVTVDSSVVPVERGQQRFEDDPSLDDPVLLVTSRYWR